ncbi:MAG: methionine--tRNA ligase, partial [Nitrospirota bacterium]|nr:methionine--tRNA ligase [Nitrospirota bacterium]
AEKKRTPKEHADIMVDNFRNLWKRLNISNDAFIRTTDDAHIKSVQGLLQMLWDRGEIEKREYSGWYCTPDERFWTEKDIVEGNCPDCGRPVDRIHEENYFFLMSKYQERLIKYIEETPSYILPDTRRNEVLGFLRNNTLGDLCISRPKNRLSWGIPLPFDENFVTYVWFDALVNYVSGLEYLPPAPSQSRYWPASVHLVGKDILTTHAVYWSTMLMALNLPLPETIFAHGWWTVDGEKMSKSRGNVVDPNKMIDEFGADAFRYFLFKEVPFGQDGDFSQSAMVTNINSDLANGIGNLLSRTLTMIERFAHGTIPAIGTPALPELEARIAATATGLPERIDQGYRTLAFRENLQAIWELIGLCDEYIDKAAPWKLAKNPEDQPRINTVLNTTSKALRLLSVLMYPYMPHTAGQLAQQLGLSFDFSKPILPTAYEWDTPLAEVNIYKGPGLFPRIESKPQGAKTVSDTAIPPQPTVAAPASATAAAQVAPLAAAASAPAAPAQITIDDFMKIQLKTAKVISAERVPKSEKLLKLQVSVGSEQRQIVAGIGKKYEPEALIGKMIIIVANLKPAKLMGIESQGMVLAAGDSEVRGLATILEEVDPGTKVK